jgi:hypothetical protein
MSFKLIRNRTQDIAVKGFVATFALSIILQLTHLLPISITLPFVMPWMVAWLIGYGMVKNN